MSANTTHVDPHELSQYAEGLFGYAMTLTRNRDVAEDLVQETYVRALRAIGRLRSDGNIKAWLFTILRNTWINEIRRRASQPIHEATETDDLIAQAPADPSLNPTLLYAAAEQRNKVIEAIQQLGPEAREIILLREYEDLSYQEIATILNCPMGTVMSRLDRARGKLRELLRDYLQTETSSNASRHR